MEVGLCLFIKDENQYLREWTSYHASIGFRSFIFYDNGSKEPVRGTIDDLGIADITCEVIEWADNGVGKQMRAYYDCATKNKHLDWIGFIDTDEFIILRENATIQEFLANFGPEAEAVGLNWVCYGSDGFQERQSFNAYRTHIPKHDMINSHIKSIVRPASVHHIPFDPHYFSVRTQNENGAPVVGPHSTHSSNKAYIRHNLTRSRSEYEQKIIRGRGDGVPTMHSIDFFEDTNRNCTVLT